MNWFFVWFFIDFWTIFGAMLGSKIDPKLNKNEFQNNDQKKLPTWGQEEPKRSQDRPQHRKKTLRFPEIPEKRRQGRGLSKRILKILDRNLARAWQRSLTRHALPKGRAADMYPTALRASPPPCQPKDALKLKKHHKLVQVCPKFGPKLAPSWPQVGPKLAQVGPNLAPSWPSWGVLGPSWKDWEPSWPQDPKKCSKSQVLARPGAPKLEPKIEPKSVKKSMQNLIDFLIGF